MSQGLFTGLGIQPVVGRLFAVPDDDPGAEAVVILVAGALASYVPARQATRVDPAAALRAK